MNIERLGTLSTNSEAATKRKQRSDSEVSNKNNAVILRDLRQ